MPHRVMASTGSPLVETYARSIQLWLRKAKLVKHYSSIEPALPISEFDEQVQDIASIRELASVNSQQVHYAAIETAIRNIFYDILVCDHPCGDSQLLIEQQASTSIDQPSFCEIWNLFDIVVIVSDNGQEYFDSLSLQELTIARILRAYSHHLAGRGIA